MAGAPSSILNSVIPPPSVPIADKNGVISQQWLFFMMSLAARTGGNTGTSPGSGGSGISSADLQAATESITIELAMDGEQPPVPSISLSMFDLMGDAPDDQPRLDPILAALMVSD